MPMKIATMYSTAAMTAAMPPASQPCVWPKREKPNATAIPMSADRMPYSLPVAKVMTP